MSALQIRQRMEMILKFMETNWEFVNCHMVNYFTDKHWDNFIPMDIRNEVTHSEISNCIDAIFHCFYENTKFPATSDFLTNCQNHCLKSFPEISLTLNQFYENASIGANNSKLSIKEFMSEKKQHEVETTASLINDLVTNYMDSSNPELYVIDAGDGKGYLSSRLALQYGQTVLGIDCNASNTENALKRNQKLQKAWNGLTERANLQSQGIKPKRRGKQQNANQLSEPQDSRLNLEKYKTTAAFISPHLNFDELLQNHFPSATITETPYCLTGLHTCGNLAATCCRIFCEKNNCRILCNIGCCYHLLKESYTQKEEFFNAKKAHEIVDNDNDDDDFEDHDDYAFPMSQFLKNRLTKLGRNARMLAAQSIERTLAAKELPKVSLFYRALLEVLVREQSNSSITFKVLQVGKLNGKYENFAEYLQLCARKLNLDLKEFPSNEELQKLEAKYAEGSNYLNLFYLLRMSFAPILESLILLDRLLYLKESGFEESYLVDLFNAVISPRHYAIIALKP